MHVAAAKPCWVRVNRPTTDECGLDLEALKGIVLGLRLPKVEGAADWNGSRHALRAYRSTARSNRREAY